MANSADRLPLLRWLHLTDLHVGKNSETQRVAMQSLLKSVSASVGQKTFDLVVLTGDLANSGLEAEFETLRTTLIEPLRSLTAFKDAIFVAVPGNHDLDCDSGCPTQWSGIGTSRQDNFFNIDAKGQQIRSSRSPAFAQYSSFVKAANIRSVDPTVEPAKLETITVRGKNFALVPVVTSFFSDKEVKDYQKAPMPVQPIRALLLDGSQDYVLVIILGHHPSSWFLQETDRRFDALIFEENALYLHGHTHQVTPKFSGRGLTSLGFGASYQASLDSAAKTYYRNSYAICELDDYLHVQVISWDSENGLWRPDQHLPADFVDPSERLSGGYKFKLPSTTLSAAAASPLTALASAVKSEDKINRCVWQASDDAKRWTEVLVAIGHITPQPEFYKLPARALPAGHVQFRLKDARGQYLVHGISANGDVLNHEQLKSINTELDTQDYVGCYVLTMGTLAKDTRTLADQLSARKPLHVLERTEIVRSVIRAFTPEQRQTLTRVNPERTVTSLVITDKGLALLFEDRTKHEWFSVLDEVGNQSNEASPIVCKLRESTPALSRMKYESALEYASLTNDENVSAEPFDRAEYLRKTHAYHDDVRYAPLAALGVKFKKSSLSEMYVSASADVGGTTKTSQNATRALTELMESLGLPKAQRDQLEAQLRTKYGLERTAEVGAATQLYQRYNNIVVLGDPGSGKTCFLKHEILSYCLTKDGENDWYSTHLPVYVSLAEAAKLHGEGISILEICTGQSFRRGIELPKHVLEDELASGRVAFFFDGLDEVGQIDKRIGLMVEIEKLVKAYAQRGNRFVLASRPAAVQPVDVPDSFTYVQLKGLTEDEMRILARRVMTARLGEETEDFSDSDEDDLVERLLADTRNSPGIARIAKNPLLLTLLVLIYANTGALTAKRHVIYTQAIKTLVSVRGREQRQHQISEADLRTRLGAVAISIFSRQIDEIPKRSEVVNVLRTAMPRADGGDSTVDVEAFLQEVAEATGLLSIHSQNEGQSPDDLITFMHFSFLEYYTAAGLIRLGHSLVLTRLSRNPRWKDVTTLMFGILSDYRDVTSDLKTLLHDETDSGQITQYKLLLAMDCASECDVPPEATQDLLANALYDALATGAARYSGDLREQLAAKLQYFLPGAGPRLERAIVRGLTAEDPLTVAAFCHLVAFLDGGVPLSPQIRDAFEIAIGKDHPVIRTASLIAIEEHFELRTSLAKQTIGQALKGNLSEKHAALKVLCAIPEFQGTYSSSIRSLLDDSNPLISELAAHSLLIHGLRTETWNGATDTPEFWVREKILSKLNQSDQELPLSVSGITLDIGTLDGMLASADAVAHETAIRYLVMVSNDSSYIHRTLSRTLRSTSNGRLMAACLDSFRASSEALTLFNIADTDFVCELIKHRERNVRLAALKLLGELPDDEQIVESLRMVLENLKGDRSREPEISEAAKALAKHVRRNTKLRNDVLDLVLSYLPQGPEDGFGDDDHQEHLRTMLYACESIGGVNERAALRVLSLAESFRTPDRLRQQAIRTFGRLAEPSISNVNRLCTLLDKKDIRLKDAVYQATTAFVRRCSARVEYVRRVYKPLATLQASLEKAWVRELSGVVDSIDPTGPRDIRAAIIEIENLTAAYEEFSERAGDSDQLTLQVSEPSRGVVH